MSVEENVKRSKLPLQRSASFIEFGCTSSPNSNLRVTKSYTGIMGLKLNSQETKGTQMNNNNNDNGNCGEMLEDLDSDDRVIETLDIFKNEIMLFKESLLNYQGRKYLINDISNKWKKDCRMWLWKNRADRRNIGDLCINQNAVLTMS
ncbi:hypothetical protein WA026_006597 [Henosepilachna vigintioctopunctata]|uniref:Uncharacterized protein n=1 Tax=Henosepilachna vigintioctopunctata TaxID=420089 RepID=A0AAW1UH43_9CUCU